MKLALSLLVMFFASNVFAAETKAAELKANTKTGIEKTMQNYVNKPKDVQKDLDKSSAERQKQLDEMDKKIDSDGN